MKKIFCLFLGVLFFSTTAFAAELEPEGTMLRKLQRGGLNVSLCWMELNYQLVKEGKKDTFPPGWLLGIGKGSIGMVGRAVTGVYEIVSFPVPFPSGYKPILQPEFPYQHFDK